MGRATFRIRPYSGSPFHFHSYRYFGRVYDSSGRPYAPAQITFSDPHTGTVRYGSKLVLTLDMQLLETGAVAYTVPVADFKFYLEPGRFRVLTGAGQDVVALALPPEMHRTIQAQVASQKELLSKALPDHERWLSWIGWARFTSEVQDSRAEINDLKAIDRALDQAIALWGTSAPPANAPHDSAWIPLFPSVYLVRPVGTGSPEAVLVGSDGTVRYRSFRPSHVPTAEDRFLGELLKRLPPGR